MTIENPSPLILGNQAFRNKDYATAIEQYLIARQQMPSLSDIINTNITLARTRQRWKQLNASQKKQELNFQSLSNQQKTEYDVIATANLDWSTYFIVNKHRFVSTDPIIDYIFNWKKYIPDILNYFSTEFYLDMYPDIKTWGVNPLLHYIAHGKSEGRLGLFPSDKIVDGHLTYDARKETIVLVSHESSTTGAPLLGYAIADKLNQTYNIVHIIIKKANIHAAFLDNCHLMFYGIEHQEHLTKYFLRSLINREKIKCVIINSIVGYHVMYHVHKLNLPLLFLIHEFSDYTRPFGLMINAVKYSDVVIVPAKIIRDSLQKEFLRFANHKEMVSNLHIIPQGKLPVIPETYGDNDSVADLYKKLNIHPADKVKIIVAAGWVQIRKGTDLFITTAKYIKQLYSGKCKFVWVGEGFNPDYDLTYSVYLNREIEYSGLGDDFLLLRYQKNLDAIFSITDVFCLPSRMDPFPNVVIDALSHDLHIACFKDGSGSAEFLLQHHANCTVVDYVDSYALATGIINYFNGNNKQPGINSTIAATYLNFDHYVDKLNNLIIQAAEFRQKSNSIVDYLMNSGEFDLNVFGGEGMPYQQCRFYVENGLKGMHFKNPKIGFSELTWLAKNSNTNSYIVPLYEALRKGENTTHEVIYVPNELNAGAIDFIYAVHLHLYYLDMAELFSGYFINLPGKFDLYITIVNPESVPEVEKLFSTCGANKVTVVVVKNIGRDMGPFLFSIGQLIQQGGYEVVGHFHSKKSLDINADMGNKWLTFLMQNLIGDRTVATSVLSIFNNSKIGLVFPEDAHAVGICENYDFIVELCRMLNLPEIDVTPLFPIGNMFWARVRAIQGLFALDANKILQPEPLPYDGTYMHALERITPYITTCSGYTTQTIYKRGTTWQ